MRHRLFLPALFLIAICIFTHSTEITAELVELDLRVCNEELSKIRLNVEYLSFLTSVFDSALSHTEKDSVNDHLKDKEELIFGELVNLNEQGIVLEKLINKQDSTQCTPCFQSTVGNYCKDILILRNRVDQRLISAQNYMAEKAVCFSEILINHVKIKIVNGPIAGLLPAKLIKLNRDVKTAEKLYSARRHKEALVHILETVRDVYNWK